MPRIIVFGDIDISTLYLKIDDEKELAVRGKHPKSFTVSAGTHNIFATTVSKLERVANGLSDGGFVSKVTAAVQNSTNTTLVGEIDFDEDDVLLIEVEQKGLKTVVHHKIVSASEVSEYVDQTTVEEADTKKVGKKIAIGLVLILGVILFMLFMFVFMARSPS